MITKATARTTKLSEPVSYQNVLEAPPHKVAEIIAGTLYMSPRPASKHARASSGLGARIGMPYDYGDQGPGGWWIIDEPELHLGKDILVPDLAGWRRERMPDYPDVAYLPWHRTGSARSSRLRPGHWTREGNVTSMPGKALHTSDLSIPMHALWRPSN